MRETSKSDRNFTPWLNSNKPWNWVGSDSEFLCVVVVCTTSRRDHQLAAGVRRAKITFSPCFARLWKVTFQTAQSRVIERIVAQKLRRIIGCENRSSQEFCPLEFRLVLREIVRFFDTQAFFFFFLVWYICDIFDVYFSIIVKGL